MLKIAVISADVYQEESFYKMIKMMADEEEKMLESTIAREREDLPAKSEIVLSELHEPVWSVVSFEKCIKDGLTYDEAAEEMERLLAEKVPGLCLITDEAAARIAES